MYDAPKRDPRPERQVHFATAELVPVFDSDSDDDDNLSAYHVSLLPSRRQLEDYEVGGETRDRWWRDSSYYAALAIPIF